MTEEALAQQVLQEFMATRHAGSSVELLCFVFFARLQQTTTERYPLAYNRLLLAGLWRGKCHCFADENVGLRCFLHTLRDCAETRDLEVHIAPSELRCCVRDEDARAVRQADGSVGALLREHLLQKGALHRWCDEAVRAAQADGGAGCADRALWRVTRLRGTRVHCGSALTLSIAFNRGCRRIPAGDPRRISSWRLWGQKRGKERGEPRAGERGCGLLRPHLVVVTSVCCRDSAVIFCFFFTEVLDCAFFLIAGRRGCVRAVHLRESCGRTVIRGGVADVAVCAGVAPRRRAESEVPQFVLGTAVHGLTVGLVGPLRDIHMRALARQCR
ncbi:hypothetical protein C3747_20g370 [Trypanosoma cruzi]|uniref:Uncharacterized protein n=2 Tax=Trypanosoma cruzi TaxID=5693 RepID=Q4E477_TRYCC|nr:hypothetical protein, conserved [Trypanosoma cruzi]EAN99595.1 hypothetical protein, conserved [Trypanosoma cruzi]KAF8291932.1 hypothetical protein TcYC6_0118650 [Trypanosoma cruzi]KAF8292141.1 hypothetical protein TcYC6_0120550 [Trypanosoma cruzi]PWV17073.1 hypothetical protein C3747_20g370 [Trypanosoma cruzi]|eukprot:XP_821446.1 hypothetical protein [Trypanosoma cruzi strain CL Brener]